MYHIPESCRELKNYNTMFHILRSATSILLCSVIWTILSAVSVVNIQFIIYMCVSECVLCTASVTVVV